MKLLDTTFLIDLLRGDKATFKVLAQNEEFVTTRINMYEVIRGLFLQKVSPAKMQRITALFEDIKLLELDDKSTVLSADISSTLISKGKMLPDADCIIAGIALRNKVKSVVTRNLKDFRRVPKLKVETY